MFDKSEGFSDSLKTCENGFSELSGSYLSIPLKVATQIFPKSSSRIEVI